MVTLNHPDSCCASLWFGRGASRSPCLPSQRRYRTCFCTDSARASASACSGKLTRAEKGSVSTGDSAENTSAASKGRERCETVEKPKHRARNKSSQSSFIYTKPSAEGEKQGGRSKRETRCWEVLFQSWRPRWQRHSRRVFELSASLLDGAVRSNMIRVIIHGGKKAFQLLCFQPSQQHNSTITDRRPIIGGRMTPLHANAIC